MATTKPTKFINAVDINGELYYVSDSYVEENYLPLSGNQTLTGTKTFLFDGDNTSNIELGTTSGSEAPLQINYDNSNYYALHLVDTITNSSYLIDVTSAENEGSEINLTLPNKSGTFALLEDLTDGYVTTDTDQYITGVKTFQNSILLNKYDPDLPHLGTNEGKLGFNDDSNLVELEIKYDPGYAGSGTSKTDLDARGLAVLFTGTRTIPAYSTSYNASSISYTPNALSDDPISYTYNFPTESGTLATQEYVDAHVGGEQIPEKLTLAYNLVTNQYQVTKQGIKFGSEQEYGGYIRRQLQTTSGQAITDEETIKDYLYFMTGVDVLPTYDTSTNQTCFLFLTSNNTCWKLQYDSSGLWAYKVENFPFATKSYVDTCVKKSGDTMTGNLNLGGDLVLYRDYDDFDVHHIQFSQSGNVKLSCPDNDTLVADVYGNTGLKVQYSDNYLSLHPYPYGSKGCNYITSKISTNNYSSIFYLPDVNASETLATQEWVTANAGGAKNIKDETPTGALSQLKDGTTFTFINPNSQYNNENIPIGASGQYATSLGGKSRANGKRSLATGTSTFAFGDYSHVEGNASISEGIASHAEGLQTTAKGDRAHTEGQLTLAVGSNAHAEGYSTVANSYSSHAEGAYTKTGVSDRNGWVEWISSDSANLHIDTTQNISVISATCSRGAITTAVDNTAHDIFVSINGTIVDANNKVLIRVVYALNGSTPTPPGPTPDPSVDSGNTLNHAEGYMTQAFGAAAHSEGHTTAALGQYSHAEGIGNVAFGLASHVEGADNEANGKYSHAGGSLTKVNGMNSIAVGGGLKSNADNQAIFGKYNLDNTSAFVIGNGDSDNNRTDLFKVNETGVYYKNAKLSTSDDLAVIKGAGTASFKTSNSTVANQGSAAIGYGTTATAWGSLSFGASSKATQSYAVAGGQASEANAEHSFAFGEVVKTTNQYQVAFGKYNAMKTDTLFEIGNGTSSNRENVFEVHEDGHAEVKSGMKIVNGNLQIGNTTLTEAQLQKLLALLDAMEVR